VTRHGGAEFSGYVGCGRTLEDAEAYASQLLEANLKVVSSEVSSSLRAARFFERGDNDCLSSHKGSLRYRLQAVQRTTTISRRVTQELWRSTPKPVFSTLAAIH
jgi:hypothetical protein